MLRRVTIGFILLLLVFSSNAQRIYSEQHLRRLSTDELFLNKYKSLELIKKSEVLTITGAGVSLLGLAIGAVITNSNSSDGGSSVLSITAATMLAAGGAATFIGFTLYLTGTSRVHKINNIQYVESLRLELIPCGFHCKHTQSYQTGITLRLRF